MSETEPAQPTEKTIRVVVDKEPDKEENIKEDDSGVYDKAEKYDELVNVMAQSLNEKHGTDLFTGKSLEDMENLDKLLSEKEQKRKPSTGVVSLKQKSKDDIWTREYPDAESFLEAVYSARRNETDPEKRAKLDEAVNSLWKWMLENKTRINVVLDPAPKGLSPKHDHWEYTRWLRRRVEQEARRRQQK